MTIDPGADGPPPYHLRGEDRIAWWRTVAHPEWLELEVAFWIGGLRYDPRQEPSVRTASDDRGEVRRAVIPGTWVGVSYVVYEKAKAVWLVEVADVP